MRNQADVALAILTGAGLRGRRRPAAAVRAEVVVLERVFRCATQRSM
jgi:hypothetical protein